MGHEWVANAARCIRTLFYRLTHFMLMSYRPIFNVFLLFCLKYYIQNQ
jgi:hypothetical protein